MCVHKVVTNLGLVPVKWGTRGAMCKLRGELTSPSEKVGSHKNSRGEGEAAEEGKTRT